MALRVELEAEMAALKRRIAELETNIPPAYLEAIGSYIDKIVDAAIAKMNAIYQSAADSNANMNQFRAETVQSVAKAIAEHEFDRHGMMVQRLSWRTWGADCLRRARARFTGA